MEVNDEKRMIVLAAGAKDAAAFVAYDVYDGVLHRYVEWSRRNPLQKVLPRRHLLGVASAAE